MKIARALQVIIWREFKRFWRQRGRLLSTVARPMAWLFLIGSGFSGIVAVNSPYTYRQFMMPGVLGLVILFSAMLTALSTVYDREFGIMRMMLIAPLRRVTLVGAKVISSAVLSIVQAVALLVLLPVLGIHPSTGGIVVALVGITLTSFSIAAVGMWVASLVESLENFAVVMNFVVFPMFFLSGGLYPVRQLPEVLQWAVWFNPLTYGIDMLKHGLLGEGSFAGEIPLGVDTAVLVGVTLVAGVLAARGFDREGSLSQILGGKR